MAAAKSPSRRSRVADAIDALLDPIPYASFIAALIADIVYVRTAVVFWNKAAAWLIVWGLVVAVVPRLVNLVQVWVTRVRASRIEHIGFWLNLLGIVFAIFNAFVHMRDAYATMPTGVWLSVGTVVPIAAANLLASFARRAVAP